MSKAKMLLAGAKQLAKGTTKPIIPESQEKHGFYQTLFRQLLASIPAEMKTDPAAFIQIKMLATAVNGLTEDNAKRIAQHIKAFGAAIIVAEKNHGINPELPKDEESNVPNPRDKQVRL